MRNTVGARRWRVIAAVEVALAAVLIAADVLIPTMLVLGMLALSLRARRQHLRDIGLVRIERPGRTSLEVLGLVVAWSIAQLALFMPVIEHLTGERQDVTDLAEVEGDLLLLVVMLVLSWTLAAVGEELVYRGYLQARLGELVGPASASLVVAVVGSSVIFGLAHTEQGLVGVLITFLDGLFFSALRLHYRSVWASVLGHGFNNTIGLVAFYLVGPISGWW